MIIRSKRIFIEGKLKPAALVIVSGRISAIKNYTYEERHGLDLGDLMLLPGAIDAHVHFRDPEAVHKEDFATGSMAAIAGGVTSIMDMPNYSNPPTTTVGAYLQKERIASSAARCDFALHFGGTNDNADLASRFSPPTLKVFMSDTHSPLTVTESGLERHFISFNPKKPVLVHCEDAKLIDMRKAKYQKHEEVRDASVAVSAVKRAAAMGKKYARRVHFCHLSTAGELKAAKIWKGASAEVTPHHLFLDKSDIERLKGWGNVNPPLRSKADVAALWKALKSADCIASDHAPHGVRDKDSGASGFPGVQTMVPLVLDAVQGGKMKLPEAIRLLCTGPAQAMGIKGKGQIAIGFDADLVVFDPKKKWNIAEADLYSKCGWSPYTGRQLRGRIEGVFLRGEEAVISNQVQGAMGRKLEFEKIEMPPQKGRRWN